MMNLSDCIAALLEHKSLPDLVQAAKTIERPTATKADADAALKTIPALIGANDRKVAHVVATRRN